MRAVLARLFLAMAVWMGCMPPAPAAEDMPHFAINEYRVLGNTVLAPRDLELLLYPRLGADKTIADVEAARKALEQLYRDSGYGAVYVDIPEQNVDEGVVRLKVTEGRLDRVRVSGARYYLNGRIRAEMPALAPGSVVKLPELQAQIAALNQDSADRQVTPVLRAGRDPGTVEVELKVKDELPLHASAELNNRYTANTTQTRLALNASYDNLFQRYQSLSLQYQTAPQKTSEVRVLAATYMAPLIGTGQVLAFYVVDTNSSFAAAGASGDYGVLGKGRIYGARYVARLEGDGSATRSLTLGADYKDFSDDIVLSSATDRTPIQYLGWTAAYAESYRDERTSGSWNIAANFGLRGLVNDPDQFSNKRYLARANYFYVRADGQYELPLFAGGTVFGHLSGQWAAEPLISNEGFAIGGAESVRGYLESAQLGDLGASATLELRTASFHRWLGPWAQRFFGFAFADGGVVANLDPLPAEVSRHQLLSAGAGLRLTGGRFLATLDWAHAFRASTYTPAGDSRVDFQFRYGL